MDYVTNNVTIRRRSLCLHTFGIFRKDKMFDSVEMHLFFNFHYTGEGLFPDTLSFFEIKFYFKI